MKIWELSEQVVKLPRPHGIRRTVAFCPRNRLDHRRFRQTVGSVGLEYGGKDPLLAL